MDVEDGEVLNIIENVLHSECQPCSVLRLTRRAACTAAQALKCMKTYLEKNKDRTGLEVVYLIRGTKFHEGLELESISVAKSQDIAALRDSFNNFYEETLYALYVGEIEVSLMRKHNSQSVATLLRGDHYDAPSYITRDAQTCMVDVSEMTCKFQSQMSDAIKKENEALIAQASTIQAASAHNHKPIEIKKQKVQPSIQSLFQKAQEKTASPQKEPPLQESPFKATPKRNTPSPEQTKEDDSPIVKKRGRRVFLESDDEDDISEPMEVDTTTMPEEPKKTKSQKVKPRIKKDTVQEGEDSDLFESQSQKGSSQKRQPKMNLRDSFLKTESKPADAANSDTQENRSGSRKKTMLVQSQETVLDEDGFMVTRPAMVEVEIDEDKEAEESARRKEKQRALMPTNVKAKAPKGQASLTSFFKPK